MIRVAIDARLVSTHNTGDTSYWRGLIGGLETIAAPDVQIVLYSNSNRPDGFAERFEWREVGGRSSRWWSLVDFPRIARAEGADVIHTQYNLSPLARGIGVTTIHDVSFMIDPAWYSPKDRALLNWQIPPSIRRAAKVLTVSETSRQEIEKFVPHAKGKVLVTPNALSPQFDPPGRGSAREKVQQEFGLTRPFLFAISSAWPRKNSQLAIDAWRLVKEACGVDLVMCGPGSSLPNDVISVGYVEQSQIAALYAAADGFLLPSFHEGFGIPVIEAFAAGCPVIASTGGAIPEVAAGAAFLVESYKPAAWADTIREVLCGSGTVQNKVEQGRNRVKDFSWERTAQLTLDVYREVASRAR